MTVLPVDLRVRLGMVLILIVAVSQLVTLVIALTALSTALLLALRVGVDRRLWHRLVHIEAFMILLFLALPFTVSGTPVATFGPLVASWEGVAQAALIAAKVTTSVVLAFVFLGSGEPERLGEALIGLRVPEPLVRMFVMMVRYLAVVGDEARRLQEAMRARGFRAGSNRHTWRSYGNLAGMLLIRALARAHRVEEAMRCRAYSGRFPWQEQARLDRQSWAWIGLAVGIASLLTGVDRL